MLGWLILLLLFVIAAIAVLNWRFGKVRTEYGSAHFLTLWQAARTGLLGKNGIPLGDWDWAHLPINFDHDGHILTVAPPGGGKSSTGSIPSGLSDGIKSRFIADPDGEITAACIEYWRQSCDHVFVINPAAIFTDDPWNLPQHSFDPMQFVDPDRPDFSKRAQYLAASLITPSSSGDASSEYFKSQAVEKLVAYILYGALHGMSLPEIADLMALSVVGDGDADINCQFDLWEDMQTLKELDGLIGKEASDLIDKYNNSPPEFQAIFSTMKDGFKFLKEPLIRRALEKDEVDWHALKTGKTAIAVVMPVQDWKLYPGFVKLAFLSAVWALDEGKVSSHRVHILLEEFPALGRLAFFSEILATGRKKKAQIEIVIQNTGQLRANYPEWRALIPNFEVRRFKAVRDVDTAKYVREAMGRATRKFKDINDAGRNVLIGQDLMAPDEIMTMPPDRQIVFIGNQRPALLGQYPYWNKKDLRKKALPSPFYSSIPKPEKYEDLRVFAADCLRIAVWVLMPSPVVLTVGLAILLFWANPQITIEGSYNSRNERLICKRLSIFGTSTDNRHLRWNRHPSCSTVRVFGWPEW